MLRIHKSAWILLISFIISRNTYMSVYWHFRWRVLLADGVIFFYNISRYDSPLTGIYLVFSNFVSHIDFISFAALLLPTGLRVHNLNWTSCPLILIPYATCYRIPMQSADYDDDFPFRRNGRNRRRNINFNEMLISLVIYCKIRRFPSVAIKLNSLARSLAAKLFVQKKE